MTLAAREWGAAGGLPMLAAHGWLDNAGSFDLLAPLLPECHLVALDLAGHGASDFRSADAGYNIWQDVGDLLEVADQLGWQQLSLLGHSRGAAIAMLFAACFPERVTKLVLLEGGLPLVGAAADAPAALASAFLERRRLRGKTGRVFATREAAIAERAQGFSKVTRAAAEVLARRSLRETAGGYVWHADQRLKATSEIKLTAEHVRAFVSRVTAPVLLIFAEDGPFRGWPIYRDTLQLFANLKVEEIPGGHHMHLEGAQQKVAASIHDFLAD